MKLSKHNVEQMARGHLMYELAKRGYNVQITDSRFPAYDLLVVSPSGEHFGIEVKGQSTKNFWRFNDRDPHRDMYYAFVYVPQDGTPRLFIMNSKETMKLWKEYKARSIKISLSKGKSVDPEDPGIMWGLRWTQTLPFEDNYDAIPK
jgi:hypothetical protein